MKKLCKLIYIKLYINQEEIDSQHRNINLYLHFAFYPHHFELNRISESIKITHYLLYYTIFFSIKFLIFHE